MTTPAPYDYAILDVRRVVDGDTVDLTLGEDIGFYITTIVNVRFRLLGIDTPERGQPGYAEAGEYVRSWLAANAGKARCSTHKADSFGRWLAYVYITRDDGTVSSLNDDLVAAGHAVVYTR